MTQNAWTLQPLGTIVVQDALEVAVFTTSEEAFGADDLFNAYRSGSADEVKAVIASKSLFMNLDNQASRRP